MKKFSLITILICFLLLPIIFSDAQEYYKCKDASGNIFLSNTHIPENCSDAKTTRHGSINNQNQIYYSQNIYTPAKTARVQVVRINDGDTIEVNFNGRAEKVRYIGIDTPEYNQEYGKEAIKLNEKLVGNTVELEFDVQERDKYGRLLAYIWKNEKLINETLVRKGLALIATYPPNVKYVERFQKAQEYARNNREGFWAKGGLSQTPYEYRKGINPNSNQSYKNIYKEASKDRDIISWQDAHKYYNQYKTVEGNVATTYNSGKAIFLNFHPDWKIHFTAVIFSSNTKKFSHPPEDYYRGKKVIVTGTITEYRGKPQIIVSDPGQIKITE
jgi:micrococcal nuclease